MYPKNKLGFYKKDEDDNFNVKGEGNTWESPCQWKEALMFYSVRPVQFPCFTAHMLQR